MGTTRKSPAYYSVYATRDGTIVMALASRKPSKQPRKHGPAFDEDGCFNWNDWDWDGHAYSDWAKAVVHGAVVNHLNLKKTLRSRVEVRLDRIEQQVATLAAAIEQFTRQSNFDKGQGATTGQEPREQIAVETRAKARRR